MRSMQVTYKDEKYTVPQHTNTGMWNHCGECPGGTCLAPLSRKDKIETLLENIKDNLWTYQERLRFKNELIELRVPANKIPAVKRSDVFEECTRCHQKSLGRDEILKMKEYNNQLYCPTCARG